MIRSIYSFVFYLAVPLLLLRLLYRSMKAPAYRSRWLERFAYIDLPKNFNNKDKSIWVHVVSVGETLASVPLIKHLLNTYPQYSIVVTTMTPTGSARVLEIFGDSVFHTYIPYDLPGAMDRFIRKTNPGVFIILETELWPNALYQCRKLGIRTMLVNARLSEKSAIGYKRISFISREMLGGIDCIAAQGQPDAQRFIELGADPSKVVVTGSLKFEMELPETKAQELPAILLQVKESNRKVIIAASTREGEDEKVLSAFHQCLKQQPSLLLVLVPRHPERFESVANLCERQQLNVILRSGNKPVAKDTQVLIGDSMGEMWLYYSLADIAFVGGSLVNTGCHNVLEPAALGIPVLVGPSQYNFELICRQLQQAGALNTVRDANDLGQQLLQLLSNPERCRVMGAAGKNLVESNKGSLEKLKVLIKEQLRR